jgi:hypothetical protein
MDEAANQLQGAVRMFSDLWRGQMPLTVTFWLFGVAIMATLEWLFVYFGVAHPTGGLGIRSALIVVALNLVTAVYWIFVSIAIWRSAGAYEGPQIWSLLARGAVLAIYLWTMVRIALAYH